MHLCVCVFCFEQKTGNAIRAVGRMATLSASRRNSGGTNSTSTPSPRPSLSGNNISRMSSLNEEDTIPEYIQENASVCLTDMNSDAAKTEPPAINKVLTSVVDNRTECENIVPLVDVNDVEFEKSSRMRVCSERSDSGISDCSVVPAQSNTNATPLLSKKFSINEETDNSITIATKNIINNNSTNNEQTLPITNVDLITAIAEKHDDVDNDSTIGKVFFVLFLLLTKDFNTYEFSCMIII